MEAPHHQRGPFRLAHQHHLSWLILVLLTGALGRHCGAAHYLVRLQPARAWAIAFCNICNVFETLGKPRVHCVSGSGSSVRCVQIELRIGTNAIYSRRLVHWWPAWKLRHRRPRQLAGPAGSKYNSQSPMCGGSVQLQPDARAGAGRLRQLRYQTAALAVAWYLV